MVRRNLNRVAFSLAKQARLVESLFVWKERALDFLMPLLFYDIS